MDKIFIKVYLILFWCFVFSLLIYNGSGYLDHDFGWHLKVGQEIYQTSAVPDIEHYGYILGGERWVDHEWFLNYLTFFIYQNYGYFSLVVFFALIALLTYFILYKFIRIQFNKSFENNILLEIVLSFFILLGVYASLPHLGVRMQEFTTLFLLILLIILYRYAKTQKTKILYLLPLLFFLWANIHAGFLIGLFLLIAWCCIKIFERLSFNYKKIYFFSYQNSLPAKRLYIFILFIALSFLATLINPYSFRLYEFLSSYSNGYYLKNIMEWQPFYFLPIFYKQIFYSAIAASIFLIFTIFSIKKYKLSGHKVPKLKMWDVFLFLLFLYLAQKSKRHFPLFFISSLPILFYFFIKFFTDSFLFVRKKINLPILSFFIIAALSFLLANQTLKINYVDEPFYSYCDVFPCGATQFLKNNKQLQEKRVFNNYGWGGYFIWELPEMKLFIDGRLPQFEYNNHSMLEEYSSFHDKKKIDEKISEHNIEMFLLKTKYKEIKLNWFEKYFLNFNEEKINNKENIIKIFLDDSDDWKEVYSGKKSSIYIKNE